MHTLTIDHIRPTSGHRSDLHIFLFNHAHSHFRRSTLSSIGKVPNNAGDHLKSTFLHLSSLESISFDIAQRRHGDSETRVRLHANERTNKIEVGNRNVLNLDSAANDDIQFFYFGSFLSLRYFSWRRHCRSLSFLSQHSSFVATEYSYWRNVVVVISTPVVNLAFQFMPLWLPPWLLLLLVKVIVVMVTTALSTITMATEGRRRGQLIIFDINISRCYCSGHLRMRFRRCLYRIAHVGPPLLRGQRASATVDYGPPSHP